MKYVSGNGQEGLICETLKNPFVVAVSDASQGNVSIDWQITNMPSGTTGASISNQVTEMTGSDITSSAYLKLGNLPGSYTTEARCGECTSGSPQIFAATAKCPAVPVYYQNDYTEPYDNWCKYTYTDSKTKKKVTDNRTCQRDNKGNLNTGYTLYSIANKGCALTSMSMVMGIYGSQASPQVWNWFLTLVSGYTSSGAIKWDAPSYVGLTDLAFSKRSVDDDTPLQNSLMDTYLVKCVPVIVKVHNPSTGNWHWIVVTEKSSNAYNINDPGYRDRTNLSVYDNKIYGIVAYKNLGGCQ